MDTDRASKGTDPVDLLAEEYLARRRRGERPTPGEYAARHPEHAARILELFPALELIERLKPAPGEGAGPSGDTGLGVGPGFASGDRLRQLGDYTILRELGRGGMGVVYEAEHHSLKNRAALKVMHLRFRADPAALQRFQREARSAARLHHTNIVPVFDFGEQDGVCYYAMQYIAGVGLERVLEDVRRLRAAGGGAAAADTAAAGAAIHAPADPLPIVSRGLLTGRYAAGPAPSSVSDPPTTASFEPQAPGVVADSPMGAPGAPTPAPSTTDPGQGGSSFAGQSGAVYFREVARLAAQVADALDHAHRQGVVHRDIKPSNLLLDARGNIWVTDFGLAKLVEGEDLSRSHDLVGTLRYMAPERFRGVTDPRGDVYALGATLYELVTLKPAFGERDQARLIERIAHEPPEPPRRHDRRIPRDLETLVLKALAKDPADRFSTAGELRDELGRYLESRPIRSRPIGAAERAWRWARRNPLVAGLAGAVAALLVTVAVVAVVGYVQTLAALKRTDAANREKSRQLVEANRRLYQSLVSEAKAIRLARRNGYRDEVWSRLKRALAIDTPDRDPAALRQLAVDCLGDFVGLRPEDVAMPGPVCAMAVHPRGDRVLIGLQDGPILVYRTDRLVEETRLTGHKAQVSALAFAPDGRTMISSSVDGVIRLWGSDDRGRWTDSKALTYPGPVGSLAVTPDGHHLVACGPPGGHSPLLAWALPEGTPESGFGEGAYNYGSLAISPDGRFLAAGCADAADDLVVFDLTTRRIVTRRNTGLWSLQELAFSADSSLLACGGQNGLAVFETGDFQRDVMLRREVIYAIAFGPDRRLLAFADTNGQVTLWDLNANQAVFEQRRFNPSFKPAFAPDGSALFAPGLQSFRRWRLTAPDGKRELIGHTSLVTDAQFSPDGRLLATTSHDRTLRIWDAATGQCLRTTAASAGISAAAFSPDGRVIASGDLSGAVRLWDVASGRELGSDRIAGGITCVGFSPRGDRLAVTSFEELDLWDVRRGPDGPDGSPQVSLRRSVHVPGYKCRYLCFSPDGQWLAWSDWSERNRNYFIRIWDAEAAKEHLFQGPRLLGGPKSLAFLPDSRRLLFVAHDQSVQIWDVPAGRFESALGDPGDFEKWNVSVTSDGRWLAATCKPTAVTIWDLARRERLLTLPEARSSVSRMVWSGDGRRLAVTRKDGEVVVWNLPEFRARLSELGLDWPDADPSSSAGPSISEVERLDRLDAQAREAEGRGEVATALAMLDRLIAARPGDGLLVLRRARVLAAGGQTDRATAEVDRALAVGPRERCLDALSGWAVDVRTGRLDLALWATERVIAARPGDSRIRGSRVLAFHQLGQSARREAEIALGLDRSPDRAFLQIVADVRAEEGRWAEAADLLARERRLQDPSSGDAFELLRMEASARLMAGDADGYRRLCRELLANFGPGLKITNNAAWICALGPGVLEGEARQWVVASFEATVAVPPSSPSYRHMTLNTLGAVLHNTLGAVLHRAGRDREAVERLREGIEVDGGQGEAADWLFLALAYHRLGDPAEAYRWLARASGPASLLPGASVWATAVIEQLRREAAGLILDAAFPADPFAQ